MAWAAFGDLGLSLFVAGAVFGDMGLLCERCVPEARARVAGWRFRAGIMLGTVSDRPRTEVGVSWFLSSRLISLGSMHSFGLFSCHI